MGTYERSFNLEKTMVQTKEEKVVGRDELNLAEFPLNLLSDRADSTKKQLEFSDKIMDESSGQLVTRTITITANDKYGLPTASDADVLVALIHHTNIKNNFSHRRVPFSKYELLKIMGQPDQSHYYKRLGQSMRRWKATTLEFDKSWRDKAGQRWTTQCFSLIDEVWVTGIKGRISPESVEDLFSWFSWGETIFNSIVAGNIKSLDLGIYFGLKSSISKRLYRFLDKRFYKRNSISMDLEALCFEKLGFNRNYNSAQLRRNLLVAIRELEQIGFLNEMDEGERFGRVDRGVVNVVFSRKILGIERDLPSVDDESEDIEDFKPVDSKVSMLMTHGVYKDVAVELARIYPDRIETQVSQMLNKLAQDPNKVKDPAGYLVDAIGKNYTQRKLFETQEDKSQKSAEEIRNTQAKNKQWMQRDADNDKITAYWSGLDHADQSSLMESALAEAPEDVKEILSSESRSSASIQRMARSGMRDAYIRKILGLEPVVS